MAELIKISGNVVGVKLLTGKEIYLRDKIGEILITKIVIQNNYESSPTKMKVSLLTKKIMLVDSLTDSCFDIDVDFSFLELEHKPRFTWKNKLDELEEAWYGDVVFLLCTDNVSVKPVVLIEEVLELNDSSCIFTKESSVSVYLGRLTPQSSASTSVKPPLGLIPRQIHTEQRIDEIGEAILRTISHFEFFKIPQEWIAELEDLYIQLNQPVYSIDPDLRRKIEHREAINFTFNRRTAVCIILYIFRFRRQGEYNDVKYIKHQILSQIRTDEESLSQNQTHD